MNRLKIGYTPLAEIHVGVAPEVRMGAYDARGREITPLGNCSVVVPAGGFVVSDGEFVQIDRPLKLTRRTVKITSNGAGESYRYDTLEEVHDV